MNKNWLADFSHTMRIFTVVVVTEMMVLIYALSFLRPNIDFFNRLAVLSLLAQLIAISLTVFLVKTASFFNRFSVYYGLPLLLLLCLSLTATYIAAWSWFDAGLGFSMVENAHLLILKISLATTITLLALLRYFYIQEQWEWQVKAYANAQLDALQARIKPHFLYNSLNSIASLISIDKQQAEQAVLNLSGLFRKAFAKNQSSTTLQQELEWVEQYLAIEKLRLADRLQFQQAIDHQLLEQQVPVLSIQPLIENAVLHGVEPSNEPNLIELKVFKRKSRLIIAVSNPFHPKHQSKGRGLAIKNIKKRLQISYGSQAQLEQTVVDGKYHSELCLPL